MAAVLAGLCLLTACSDHDGENEMDIAYKIATSTTAEINPALLQGGWAQTDAFPILEDGSLDVEKRYSNGGWAGMSPICWNVINDHELTGYIYIDATPASAKRTMTYTYDAASRQIKLQYGSPHTVTYLEGEYMAVKERNWLHVLKRVGDETIAKWEAPYDPWDEVTEEHYANVSEYGVHLNTDGEFVFNDDAQPMTGEQFQEIFVGKSFMYWYHQNINLTDGKFSDDDVSTEPSGMRALGYAFLFDEENLNILSPNYITGSDGTKVEYETTSEPYTYDETTGLVSAGTRTMTVLLCKEKIKLLSVIIHPAPDQYFLVKYHLMWNGWWQSVQKK